jgi:DNA invertase Pin-like site-specific DNA recombinase
VPSEPTREESAQFEREVAGERIRDKFAASRRKGMWMGGNIPLGYDVVGRRLVVNAAEAKTVKLIFERYLELGCVHALQAELDRLGIRSKHRVAETGRTVGGGITYRIFRTFRIDGFF